MQDKPSSPDTTRELAHLRQRVAELEAELTACEELVETLQLARVTLENVGEAIAWYDPDGKVHYINRSMRELYGYTEDDVAWLRVEDVDPAFTAELRARLMHRLETEGRVLVERTHRHRDGTPIVVEATNSLIRYGARQYICVVGRDIRERKQAEQEREALQQQIIATQQATLRELSTPLIPVSDRVVILPLIGAVDEQRAAQVVEALLEGVARYHAELVILDITGVGVVDTNVAQALVQAARAVRLLGAQFMLTGIHPRIAQTLVQLGVDLGDIRTQGTLQAGIAAALQRAG